MADHDVTFTVPDARTCKARCRCGWWKIERGVLAARRVADAAEEHLREAVTHR